MKEIDRDEYFQDARNKRAAIVNAVMSVYNRHGMDFEIEFKCYYRVVNVDIINFERGKLIDSKNFYIYLDSCADSLACLAKRETEVALKKLGAEFTTIEELRRA